MKHTEKQTHRSDWVRLVCRTHSVPGEGLGSVLVDNLDVTRRLDPRLPVHLNWHTFITKDGDLYCPALRQRDRQVREIQTGQTSYTDRQTGVPERCGGAAG